jgi:CBS domain-containing protein
MSTVRQILNFKGNDVYTTRPNDMVLNAIQDMARHDIGALVVVDDDGKPVGMFTERQYARNVILKGRSSPTTPVRDAMRSKFVYVNPERTVQECMALMTEHKVRHLPVIEDERLIGIVSIGDLVKNIIADQEFTIDQLSNYISGTR